MFCAIWRRGRISNFGITMLGQSMSVVTLEGGDDGSRE
jgi:hypothetical protein